MDAALDTVSRLKRDRDAVAKAARRSMWIMAEMVAADESLRPLIVDAYRQLELAVRGIPEVDE